MKVAVTGLVTAFRWSDIKGQRVGQVDILQHGDHKYPSKVQAIFVLSPEYCRMFVEKLAAFGSPLCVLECYVDLVNKDVNFELLRVLSIGEYLVSEVDLVG